MDSHAPAPRRRLSLLALLLLAAAAGVWLATREGDSPVPGDGTPGRHDGEGSAPLLEGLARPSTSAPGRPPALAGADAPSAPAPSPAGGEAGGLGQRYEDTLPKVRVRLVLEGTGEPVTPDRVLLQGGRIYPADQPVPAEPGTWLHVVTTDPRAAIDILGALLPATPGDEIVLQVPRADDPRLERLTLRVIDEVSREPLPRAYLDLGPLARGLVPRLSADAQGRIRVDRALLERSPWLARQTLPGLRAWIYEPDHEPPRSGEYMPGIAADALAAWLGRGEIDVPLRPLDADVGAAAHVRLVWSTGEPAAGLVVQGLYPTIMSVAMALRSDERGVVAWERAPSYFGLLVYEGGAPVHYVVMARRAELRDERIPRSLEVAIEIPDFEPFEGRLRLTWELEPRFLDGLDVLDPTSDDGYTLNGVRRAPGRLITDTHTPPLLEGRLVEHQPPRFSCRLPAGVRTRLFAGQGRHLDVEPARAGERIVAPWDSLARSR